MKNRENWRKLVVKSSVVPFNPCGEGIGDDDGDAWFKPERQTFIYLDLHLALGVHWCV